MKKVTSILLVGILMLMCSIFYAGRWRVNNMAGTFAYPELSENIKIRYCSKFDFITRVDTLSSGEEIIKIGIRVTFAQDRATADAARMLGLSFVEPNSAQSKAVEFMFLQLVERSEVDCFNMLLEMMKEDDELCQKLRQSGKPCDKNGYALIFDVGHTRLFFNLQYPGKRGLFQSMDGVDGSGMILSKEQSYIK